MTDPYQRISTRQTPQSESVPGREDMSPNNAGGYGFTVTPLEQLRRFLILGTAGGTYYCSERELTRANADNVFMLMESSVTAADAVRLAETVSEQGLAIKNEPALFVTAIAMNHEDPAVRKRARRAVKRVARTGTHLFKLVSYLEQFGGWGRETRNAIANWYLHKDPEALAYQLLKYQQREGWSHRDVLRLAHPDPYDEMVLPVLGEDRAKELASLFEATCRPEAIPKLEGALPHIYSGVQAIHEDGVDPKRAAGIIEHCGLTREMVPSHLLSEPVVMEALLASMPMTATIRNLGNLARAGLLDEFSAGEKTVLDRIRDEGALRNSRIHPFSVLLALKTYGRGMGFRGTNTWNVNQRVVDALDEAFYLAFQNVEPTGKRHYLGVDVSGSMGMRMLGSPLTAREAAAAVAMTTVRSEGECIARGFSDKLVDLPISPRMRLDEVVRVTEGLPFSRTDCALPMVDARDRGIDVDVFVVLTDNETWYGSIHPFQALQKYREWRNLPAKLATVAFTATSVSIADPKDAGMMDFVGMDASLPQALRTFVDG